MRIIDVRIWMKHKMFGADCEFLIASCLKGWVYASCELSIANRLERVHDRMSMLQSEGNSESHLMLAVSSLSRITLSALIE